MRVRMLLLLALLSACAAPGEVTVTLDWGAWTPTPGLYLSGRIMATEPGSPPRLVSEIGEFQPLEDPLVLDFEGVPNSPMLQVLLEVRSTPDLKARVLFYGQSAPFELAPDTNALLATPVAMNATPEATELHILGTVGPPGCDDCYIGQQVVSLALAQNRGATLEVANDNSFSSCRTVLRPGQGSDEGPALAAGQSLWRLDRWDLDCGRDDPADGPRGVYARVLDEAGYPSQTLTAEVYLDRVAPTEGTLLGEEGQWLVQLQTTLLFAALQADEFYVEACQATESGCLPIPGGLLPCPASEPHAIDVEQWDSLTTRGCIRFADDTIRTVRVKYRDLAHNETDWETYTFESITQLNLEWVPIPGGTFTMGCSSGDAQCAADEHPAHPVTLPPFELLATEVTESQFEKAFGSNPACKTLSPGTGFAGSGPNSPVECVDWHDARAFCEKVGGRLPTEAEFEYAARAGTTSKYGCGGSPYCLESLARSVLWDDQHKYPVKGKSQNAFGLYDMLGNVSEWTADWYGADYYSWSPEDSPTGPSSGTHRVSRGFSIITNAYELMTLSSREHFNPDYSSPDHGFRCAR